MGEQPPNHGEERVAWGVGEAERAGRDDELATVAAGEGGVQGDVVQRGHESNGECAYDLAGGFCAFESRHGGLRDALNDFSRKKCEGAVRKHFPERCWLGHSGGWWLCRGNG